MVVAAGRLLSCSNVRLDPGYFAVQKTALKSPSGTYVGDYHSGTVVQDKWFSWWYDHKLVLNKSKHGPRRPLIQSI